jgi:ADP-dependent NAD(P)H-hydrate dehydratase / NAD(P)H-hydrate epimerase
MVHTFWQKQTDKPLFPELLWSRPENKRQAGKLLIIGGNLHAFVAPAEAFAEAEKAGIGTSRVLLPDAAKKLVGPVLEHIEYAPSTPSGSFSQKALAEFLEAAQWSDAVLLAGDLGRNSETAILLEKFCQKYSSQLTLTKDAVDYAVNTPGIVLNRPNTLLVLSFAQLQKLAIKARFKTAFTFDMDLIRLTEALHEFTETYPIHLIVQQTSQIYCASQGKIISTPVEENTVWRVKTAAHAAVWWLQNPGKHLEAFSVALHELITSQD